MQEELLHSSTVSDNIVSSNLLTSYRLKGNALAQEGQSDPSKYLLAFNEFDKALQLASQLSDNDPGNFSSLKSQATIYDDYGKAREAQGDGKGALQAYGQELLIRQKLANKDKTNAGLQQALARIQKKIDNFKTALAKRNAGAATGTKP